MIMCYETLRRQPMVFQKCTGLTVMLFDQLVEDVLLRDLEAETQRLSPPSGSGLSRRDIPTNWRSGITCC
jgi:hypothetical protein